MKWYFTSALLLAVNYGIYSQVSPPGRPTPIEQFIVTPNTLKNNTGRMLLNFPAQTVWTIYIYKMEGGSYVTSYSHTNAPKSLNMSPGSYKITLNNAPLLYVTVKKGHDTRLKVGILKVETDKVWYLYDETGTVYHTSGNKPSTLSMPVGKYLLKNGDIENIVTVNETDERSTEERQIIEKENYIMVPITGEGKLLIPKYQPFAFPIQVPIYIYRAGDKEQVIFDCGYNVNATDPADQCPVVYSIPENFYDIYYAGVPILNVEVRKGYETRLKMGYLKHTGKAKYGIKSEDSENRHIAYSAQSETGLPWPPGKYRIKAFFINDNFRDVEIKDGQTTSVDPLIHLINAGNVVVTTLMAGHFPPQNRGRLHNTANSNATIQGDTTSNLLRVKYPNATAFIYIRAQTSHDFTPGTYTAYLNGVDFKVPIVSKHESKPRIGYLQMVQSDLGQWQVYHATQNTGYGGGNGPKTIALPVGIYRIKIGQQFFLVRIKENETLKFAENISFVPEVWQQ